MKKIYVTMEETKRVTKEYNVTDDMYKEMKRIKYIPDDMFKDVRNEVANHPKEVEYNYVVEDEDDNIITDWVD